MREDLLEILREPTTGAALDLTDARAGSDGSIAEGRLVSQETGRSYPIVKGIPRFVPRDNYGHSFGLQWNRFRNVQLDSSSGLPNSKNRFDNETGWSEANLKDRWVLDAGCGAGRFAEVAAAYGARLVGLDLSEAVTATAQTLSAFPRAHVVQASLFEPPFRRGTFDFAYSIGVLQHTPDPRASVRAVVEMVRPGGEFALTIYGRKPWTKLHSKYLVRPLTRRVPANVLLRTIERTMPYVFPVTDKLFRVPVLGKLARYAIPVATYTDERGMTREQRYEEAVLDTFDMLAPRYDNPMSPPEVERELRQVSARSWEFRTRFPVNIVGVR